MEPEILFDRTGALARITLNRPQALNALTLEMVQALDAKLLEWDAEDDVGAVLIRGAPRADGKTSFCAGGDLPPFYEERDDPEHGYGRRFYWNEYRMNRRIFRFPKPYVALVDGVVMGGGVGVSVHGSHRVVSERVLFAMPETGIGLFPDVGGSHFLPRCPGRIGVYLALTGTRLRAADVLYAGFATAHVPSASLEALQSALADADFSSDARAAVDAVIAKFSNHPGEAPLESKRAAIDRCFAGSSVEAIVAALKRESGVWAEALLETLGTKSPTSLKIAHRQMAEGARLDFESAMRLEYRLARRFLEGHDFYEGIRAVILEKDNQPRWRPARIEEVDEALVASYFAPLPDGELSYDEPISR